VLAFLYEASGELRHVRVTKLSTLAEVPPQSIYGNTAQSVIAITWSFNSESGTLFTASEDPVTMNENELWWFDYS
jgi:hypothetical protein